MRDLLTRLHALPARLLAWLVNPEMRRLHHAANIAWLATTEAQRRATRLEVEAQELRYDVTALRKGSDDIRAALMRALDERDRARTARDALDRERRTLRTDLAEQSLALAQMTELRADRTDQAGYWQRRAEQDRRNAVVLEERLAALEGRPTTRKAADQQALTARLFPDHGPLVGRAT
jgi:chromosome segregation ATPase